MSLYNQTNITNFALEIPDAGITKAFKANIQSALIPGFSIPTVNMPLGNQGIARANVPGTTIEFEPLVVRALIDEDLQTWIDIYNWALSLNNYMTHDNEGIVDGVLPKFITLHILNNDKTKIVLSIHYYSAWPQTVGDLEYSYTEDSDPAIFCNVTFQYSHYALEKDGVILNHRKSITEQVSEKKSIGVHPTQR